MAQEALPENAAANQAADELVSALAAFLAIDDTNPATATARKVMLKAAINAGVRIFIILPFLGTVSDHY